MQWVWCLAIKYTQTSPEGRVLRNWLNDGREWSFDYLADCTDVTFRTMDDKKGRTKRWLHDEDKNYTGHVDELGGVPTRQLDAFVNRTQTTLPDGKHLSWLYYGSGHLHQINLDGEVISDFERDALHREISRTQGQLQSRYQYDAVGRLTAQTAWRSAAEFAVDPAHNMMPVNGAAKDSAQGFIKNNRLEVFEDKRYRYDTHGNLIEKKIGKHTVIQLVGDVEQQLQSVRVTEAAHTNRP